MGDQSNPSARPLLDIDAQTFANHEFDFVICGGGTAGLTLAARLSEDVNVTVGVIEAGGNQLNNPLVDVPAMFSQMFNKPEYDWIYKTTPQRTNHKLKEHHMVRGKMLGGCSGINYMGYVRGSDNDYDDWATILEDESWSSRNMKRYMRKHQTLEPFDEKVTDRSTMPLLPENHGINGPIHTSFNPCKLDIEDDIIKAADQATGLDRKPTDPWSGDHIGFFHSLATIHRTGAHKGKRSYAARGYYEPCADRPNFKVVTGALVTRIILEGDKATGVAFRSKQQDYEVKVTREVLVCGGAINSPQMLELSGIGNPEILRAAGIDLKIENRAVGENLQDHAVVAASYQTAPGVSTLDGLAQPEAMQATMQALMLEQSGPLTCAANVSGFFPFQLFSTKEEQAAIIKSIEDIEHQTPFSQKQRQTVIAQLKDPKSANLQFILIPGSLNVVDGHTDHSRMIAPPADLTAPNGLALALCLQYPVSRGHVHVKSANPEEHPNFNPGWLTHDADIEVLAAGLKFLDTLANAPAVRGKLSKRIHPAPERDLTQIGDCRQAVLDWNTSEYHPCGSVAMGDALDSRLRVKGARNLRVVDASSFPGNISGAIMTTVYAIAEKAADMIKEDWRL